jgi:hypothetical protein
MEDKSTITLELQEVYKKEYHETYLTSRLLPAIGGCRPGIWTIQANREICGQAIRNALRLVCQSDPLQYLVVRQGS